MASRRTPGLRLVAILGAAALMASAVIGSAAAAERLTVFAAASLKNALDDVSSAWKAETSKETVTSYAASSALAKQIESGAPADIFISADLDWMKYLSDRKLIVPDSIVKLLGNRLVLVVPANSVASIKIAPGFDLAGLIGDGRLAICDVKSVPAGKYGKAALEALGIWTAVKNRIAQAENARAALMLVATGEAVAGIVYQTDANAEPKVKALDSFPDDSHPAIVYPVGVVASSTNPEAAFFVDFLQSPQAQEIFRKQGFTILVSAASN